MGTHEGRLVVAVVGRGFCAHVTWAGRQVQMGKQKGSLVERSGMGIRASWVASWGCKCDSQPQ